MAFVPLALKPKGDGVALIYRTIHYESGDKKVPVLPEDFVRSLSPSQREGVERAIAVHGFKLDGDKLVEI